MKDNLKWKTTSNGRQPQNTKSQISQQPLIGSYSDFILKLIWPNQNSLNEDNFQMEDDLKILKVEYLSNHLLDHFQIINLNLDDLNYFVQIL